MGLNLCDDLVATPPKLTLTLLPSHKPLPATPGALTPPFHPNLSVPFEWEEVPGRPRPSIASSPNNNNNDNNNINNIKPKSFRCLELPPRIAHVANTSPTTVLDGPKTGRTLSHRFYLEDISPKRLVDEFGLGLDLNGLNSRKSDSEFGPWNWAHEKPNFEIGTYSWHKKSGSVRSDVEIDVRMRRFRRAKGSLHKLSCKSSQLLDNIYQGLKRMVGRGCKENKPKTEAREISK